MAKNYEYVVAVYLCVVGKDGRKLEDYSPDRLSLETEDYEKAKNFYNSLDVEKVAREWLHPNEKNFCVKVEKEISRWFTSDCCIVGEYDELLEFVETPWMRLRNEEESITELVVLTEDERRAVRV